VKHALKWSFTMDEAEATIATGPARADPDRSQHITRCHRFGELRKRRGRGDEGETWPALRPEGAVGEHSPIQLWCRSIGAAGSRTLKPTIT